MGPLGWQETVFIFVIALLIFGPKKLPELGKNIAKAITEFKRASSELKSTFDREMSTLERENESLKEVTRTYENQINYDDSYNYNYDSGSGAESYDSSASSTSTVSASAPQDADSTVAVAENGEPGAPAEAGPGEVSADRAEPVAAAVPAEAPPAESEARTS